MSVLNVEVARRHRLRAEAVEQRDLRAAGDAQVGVLQRLLLLRWLRDDFDALGVKHADVVPAAVEHLHAQHEMLALVGVGDEQRFGRAVLLAVVEVELLHVVVRVADSDEGTKL